MPVPVCVTNPGGIGLAGHNLQALETSGPFARLNKRSEQSPTESTSPSESSHAAAKHVDLEQRLDDEASVVITDLSFAYPGLGKCWNQRLMSFKA